MTSANDPNRPIKAIMLPSVRGGIGHISRTAALARARELAGPGGAVLATGSIYLVADLLAGPGRRRASAL